MAFSMNRKFTHCVAILLFLTPLLSSAASSPPVIVEQPEDWNEDAAFDAINITRTSPNGTARFSCRAEGTPAPSISWFSALSGASSFLRVEQNSSEFQLLGSNLVAMRTPELSQSVIVFCEASSPAGRVRSRSALFQKRGRLNPMERSYMNPRWITDSHALVICADRKDFVTEEKTKDGATIHGVRPWGDIYSYGAYYDDHSGTSNNQEFLPATARSDIYWHGPFIVISSNITRYRNVLNIFFCQQIWSPHFITGTRQKPEDYSHGTNKYPATSGPYARYPFLNKRIYTHDSEPDKEKLPEVSIRLFNTNAKGFVLGRNITIDCLTMSLDQNLKVTWMRKGKSIESSPQSRVRSEPIVFFGKRLFINDLKVEDADNYTCVVISGGEKANYSATIAVEPKLPLELALEPNTANLTQVLEEGSKLDLECRYRNARFSEPRELVWLLNGKPVTSARGRRSAGPGWSRLAVTDLEAGLDDGCYQCMLRAAGATSVGSFAIRTVTCLRLKPPPHPLAPVITVATSGRSKSVLRVHQNGSMAGPPILVMVTDEEAGRGGRIASCDVVVENGTRPLAPAVSLPNVAAFELVAHHVPKDQKELNLVCRDANRPPVRASITFSVERCHSQCPKRHIRWDFGFARRLLRLLDAGLNDSTADGWLGDLGRLTREAERNGVDTSDFNLFLTVLRSAVRSTAMASRLGRVVEDLSRLLSAFKPDLGADAAHDRRLSVKVLNLTEAIAAALPTPKKAGEANVLRSKLLSVAVLRLPPHHRRQPGAVAHFLVPPGQDSSRAFAATAVGDAIPPGSFGIALSQAAVRGDRVEFALAAPNNLFRALSRRSGNATAPQVPASPIVSATAELTAPKGASEGPVSISLPLVSASGQDEALCAFWDFWENRWSSQGCEKVESTSSGALVSCRCAHLTNFALLLDVDRATAVSGCHQTILSILSYTLLTLSTVFLLLTVFIYATFLHRETRRMSSGHSSSSRESRITASRVLLSLCTALLLATVVFLAGSHYNRPGSLCTTVGVLLHYCYLAVFFWSVVEAAHICITVIYVSLKSNQISIHISHFFIKASAFAWGVPLLIVAITLGVNRTANYGTDIGADYRFCFLASGAFFAAFLGPMLVCLAANITILVLLALVLRRYAFASKAKGPGEKKNQWRQHLVGFIGICFILNVTWIIGALQVRAAKLPLQYLHVLVNGLQGLFIFLFYCFLRSDIRSFARKRLRRAMGIEEKPSGTSKSITSETNSMITSGDRRAANLSSGATKTELLSASAASDIHSPEAAPSADTKKVAFAEDNDGSAALLNSAAPAEGKEQIVV